MAMIMAHLQKSLTSYLQQLLNHFDKVIRIAIVIDTICSLGCQQRWPFEMYSSNVTKQIAFKAGRKPTLRPQTTVWSIAAVGTFVTGQTLRSRKYLAASLEVASIFTMIHNVMVESGLSSVAYHVATLRRTLVFTMQVATVHMIAQICQVTTGFFATLEAFQLAV